MFKRLIPLLILAIGAGGFLLLKLTRSEPEAVAPRERSWRVEVMVVEPAVRAPVVPLYGEVVAPAQTLVSATLAGRIDSRPVRDGQQVVEGDLLVALDKADVEPALEQAEADVADLQAQIESEKVRYRNDREALAVERELLENARRQLQRTQSLVERELASRENLDAAADAVARARLTVTTRERAVAEHPSRLQSLQARLARARAALAAARRDARRSRVSAPFDGVVTNIQVAPGDQVARGEPLLSIYPERGLELRARVPQRYRRELLEALASGATLEAESDQGSHRFVLTGFVGTSDPAGTDAILRLQGASADGLRPGELVPVTLERPPRPGTVALPFSALYGSDSIYLMTDDQRMRRIAVERVGEARADNGERQVLVAGPALESGSQVIVTHLPNAMTGLKVQVAGESAE